jgi:hypothetical protein
MTDPDPERAWVRIRRADLGVLLAAGHAVLGYLHRTNPKARRLWDLSVAVEAAERALLGPEPSQDAEPPGR